tara:strand:+ start:391 stop:927 length:537 start_codon:yes stop_codon:yes gene_type:complete
MLKSRPDKSVIPNNLNFERIEREVNEGGGFYHETEHHVISYTPGKRRLLVSFDNLASLKSKHSRKPWGQDIAQKNGWGSLGVMTKKNGWFRSTELTNYLSELRAQGLFESYPAVSMYGASMGDMQPAYLLLSLQDVLSSHSLPSHRFLLRMRHLKSAIVLRAVIMIGTQLSGAMQHRG